MNEIRAVPLASPANSGESDGRARSGLLSVVIPVLNEERGLPRLVERLSAALGALQRPWEVVFVDDGSTDGTATMLMALNLRDPHYKAVVLSRNFGKEIAVAAGLRYATGAATIVMDVDLHRRAIATFVKFWEQGYDVVYGQRSTAPRTARFTACHRVFSIGFQLDESYDLPATQVTSASSTAVIDVLNRMDERASTRAVRLGRVRSIGVPFQVEARGSVAMASARMRFALDGGRLFLDGTPAGLVTWSAGFGVRIHLRDLLLP